MSDLPEDDGVLPLPVDPDPNAPPEDDDLEEGVQPEEPEDGEDGPEPPPQPAEPPRQRTRRGEEARWRERYERELADLRAQVAQRPQAPQPYVDPMAQQRALQERWNQMALEGRSGEAMAEMWQLGQRHIEQVSQQTRWSTEDRIDRQAYDANARTSALHRSYGPEVERLVAAERGRGNFAVSREDILHQLVGRDAVARASRAAPGQVARGRAQVARQTTAAGTPRGDVARGAATRSQAQSDEDLLRGITTDDI